MEVPEAGLVQAGYVPSVYPLGHVGWQYTFASLLNATFQAFVEWQAVQTV
jgi:hypothetical protein